MKQIGKFILGRLVAGLLIITPIVLASLVVLKVVKMLMEAVTPVTKLLPKWLPVPNMVSLALVLTGCFIVGVLCSTPIGHAAWEMIEKSMFQKFPGYALFRSLSQRLAGQGEDNAWRPALAEIEEALVPAFIIEELENGSFTVFVPSVPTPLAGDVYVLTADRVHPVNVPFRQAIRAISEWGSGSKALVAAMQNQTKAVTQAPKQTQVRGLSA